jgi:hypothetical protein
METARDSPSGLDRLALLDAKRRQAEADAARRAAVRAARMRRLLARMALDAGEPLVMALREGGERAERVRAMLGEFVVEPAARARLGLPLGPGPG